MADAVFKTRRVGQTVGWLVQGMPLASFHWQRGDAVCAAIRRAIEAEDGSVNGEGNIQFRTELGKVLVIVDGRLRLSMEKSVMRDIGKATRAQCRLAEEEAVADRVARDGAICLRAGMPWGMTDNPKIKDMIVGEATSNPTIRKALPGMCDHKLLGAPVVRKVNRTNIERLEAWNKQLQQLKRPH